MLLIATSMYSIQYKNIYRNPSTRKQLSVEVIFSD